MVAAIAAFAAFHFIRHPEQGNDAGWSIWKDLWHLIRDPSGMNDPLGWVAVASFLTSSLLIVASPFLGGVWIKSKMAWLPTVIFGGLAAVAFPVAILSGRSAGEQPIGWGFYLLMVAPVLNFIGLLFARVAPASRPEEF